MRFLNEQQSNELLSKYSISMIPSKMCNSEEEVRLAFKSIDRAVVMKVLSADIQHKSDAGCVVLEISTEDEAINAYHKILDNAYKWNANATIDGVIMQEMVDPGLEMILGIKKDDQFGHVVLFGMGGIFVEIFKDVSMRLLPLTEAEVREMISETKISKVFSGFRGTLYNEEELVQALLNLGKLVRDHPEIKEVDINPYMLYADGQQGCGVDALIGIEN